MKYLLAATLIFLFMMPDILPAQEKTENKGPESAWAIYPTFSYQWPGGDLGERFGANSTIGPGFFYKTSHNWIWNADVNFIFGNTIREDSLVNNLINSDGFIIDDQGHYAEVSFFERGFYTMGRVGKLFPLTEKNPNSGVVFMAGAGYLQHKISIQVKNEMASPLKGDYKKGYDRFTDGFAASQFIGYMHIGNTRLANFFIGAEFVESWTKNRRSMNFDTMHRDDKNRFDFLGGIKIGWIIPFSRQEPDEYYYF